MDPIVRKYQSHEDDRTSALMKRAALRMLPRVVSKEEFYKVERARLESVIVDADQREEEATELSQDIFVTVWFLSYGCSH